MSSNNFTSIDTHPVMKLPEDSPVPDFSKGFDPLLLKDGTWGVGGYAERRPGMYTAPQYQNRRYIHMGIDYWAPAGDPVFAALDGVVAYMANHQQTGNYGPTIVLRHKVDNKSFYALHGHLSKESLNYISGGQLIKRGEQFATLGNPSENGEWHPHLHYQVGIEDPGEADMPGVVSEKDLEKAMELYPDPRSLLGNIY